MKKQPWSGIQYRSYGIALGAVGLFLDLHLQGITLGTGFADVVTISESAEVTDPYNHSSPHLSEKASKPKTWLTTIPGSQETDFHQLQPDFFLPRYPSFNSQLLDQQLILYSLHLFLAGTPDVLIVGSSRAIQGVDPETLRRSLVAQGYPALKIYNFSINGATAQVIETLLTQILAEEQLPPLIIWADGVRAFNSGRSDRTYEQIIDSEGFKQLEDGMRPILSQPLLPGPPSVCQDSSDRFFSVWSPIGSGPASPSPKIYTHSYPGQWISASALGIAPKLSKSFPSSSSCTLQAQSLTDHQTPFLQRPQHLSLQSQTFSELSHNDDGLTLVNWASSGTEEQLASTFDSAFSDNARLEQFIFSLPFNLEASGFLPNLTEFNPATYYQTYPYVSGEYDANYVPFSLGGIQANATINITQYLKSKGIDLVIVNLPLTQNYLDETRSRYENDFRQYMQQLSANSGFAFLDLNHPELAQNQYFADPSHLNANGARAVASQIAFQSDIPWPSPAP
ncbi:MAG: hypothetical protein F6K16_43195 [Symploca sp. SIO2B6]|nr:hypothetical protein [Symploca sp. SIO2B6]